MKNVPVRVLVIEDGSVSAQALCFQLERLGYVVVGVFASGEEAVRNVCSLQPDIVLIDISLAGPMDGVEAAEKIGRLHDVPVIYLTSSTDDATFHRAKETNPFAWLAKPVTLDSLHRSIGMALYKKELFSRLQSSEEKYRRIVETMSEGLVILDTEHRIVFANARFANMILTADSCVGCRVESFLEERTHAEYLSGLARLAEGERVVILGSVLPGHGSAIPVRISMSAWGEIAASNDCALENGCGIICVVTDLTEQLASASALREAENKYRTLFENALDGVFQSSPEGRFLEVNSAMASIFGYESSAVMVRDVTNIAQQMYATPADRLAFVRAASSQELVSRFQVRMKKRDGELIWVEISARAVLDEVGEVRHIEGILCDITERKTTEQDLRRRASRDDLTGLYNRVYFREWFTGTLVSATRYKKRVGVLYIDLNDFKTINDSYGHHVGDRVLREMAGRIRDEIRECDMVARIGGDEFCVVLEGLHSPEDVRRVAHGIGDALVRPLASTDSVHCLGGSVGIAVFPDDGHDVDTLIRKADEAMYNAKLDTTRSYAFWDEDGWVKSAG